MKDRPFILITFLTIILTLMSGHQRAYAQDALTSVKVNVQNISISSDRKTISYDVYLQDVDNTSVVAVPAFLFRLAVPKADVGSNEKTVTVTNTTPELGATGVKMTSSASGSDWIMKFTNSEFVQTYSTALVISETFPGTRIGTFNISNTDGTTFPNPLYFHATFPGTAPTVKNTVSIFQPNSTTLASNSTVAVPSSTVAGTGTFSLISSALQLTISDPTITLSKPYDGNKTASVTPGTLSGVLSTDVDNVTVSATATFDNANVGTGKTITISYSISGSAAANYLAPVSSTVSTGIITKKSLTISNPTLTLSKPYDGTTTAAVTAVGTLTGVVSGEAVAVTATGAYSNANAGAGKTITVTYALTGANAGNYQEPGIYSVNTGVIEKFFTVKAYLEALWNSTSLNLNKCKEWDESQLDNVDKYPGDIADTVIVELHGSTYSTIAYSFNSLYLHQDGTITSNGSSSIKLPASISGSYYVTVKSRNHLETSSSVLVSFDTNSINYDFTDDVSKAYESSLSFTPTKLVDGKWMLNAGDVLYETSYPEINMVDMYEIFNHRSSMTRIYGYSALDLNGDGFVDETDIYTLFPNRNKYLSKE